MSKTRAEVIKVGTRPAGKVFSPSVLKETTRFATTSLDSPLGIQNANLRSGVVPGWLSSPLTYVYIRLTGLTITFDRWSSIYCQTQAY